MRIGILTGGGDVPGLNPCIKTVVYSAIDEGMEVVGIRRGWGGLLEYDPDDPAAHDQCVFKLDKQNTFRAMAATDEDFSNLRGIAEFDDLVAPQPAPAGSGSTTPPKP